MAEQRTSRDGTIAYEITVNRWLFGQLSADGQTELTQRLVHYEQDREYALHLNREGSGDGVDAIVTRWRRGLRADRQLVDARAEEITQQANDLVDAGRSLEQATAELRDARALVGIAGPVEQPDEVVERAEEIAKHYSALIREFHPAIRTLARIGRRLWLRRWLRSLVAIAVGVLLGLVAEALTPDDGPALWVLILTGVGVDVVGDPLGRLFGERCWPRAADIGDGANAVSRSAEVACAADLALASPFSTEA
jgi:hypothetical protein